MAAGRVSSFVHRRRALVAISRALTDFDRPAWLYRARDAIPRGRFSFRSAQPVTTADLALSQRLIEAYARTLADAPPQDGMWSHDVFRARQRTLAEALEREDPAALAELLGSMFRSDFVLGMAAGSLVKERQWAPIARLSWLGTLNKLVSLAESLGAARVEYPKQGAVGHAFADGVDGLVARIEDRLGVSLDFPEVGGAYGVAAGGRLITPDSPDQLYAAARLRDAMHAQLSTPDQALRIVEIGGGYGGMAYWLLRMLDPARYVIIDLPIVNVLQGYFLSKALGESAVALFGEASPAKVTITPAHALTSVAAPFDVLVNKDSMPEMSAQAVLDYLRWARSACTGLFYSYNQEAAVPFEGTAQNVVAEAIERVGGFTRVRREASWLRRGYVEEVYRPQAPV
ncbi:MAG: putative sugar O-methyltransferase [Solirubrobacteraceae bacterium]